MISGQSLGIDSRYVFGPVQVESIQLVWQNAIYLAFAVCKVRPITAPLRRQACDRCLMGNERLGEPILDWGRAAVHGYNWTEEMLEGAEQAMQDNLLFYE